MSDAVLIELRRREAVARAPQVAYAPDTLHVAPMPVHVGAQFAREVVAVGGAAVGALPREVGVVEAVVGGEQREVLGERARRREVAHVDVRPGRQQRAVVGAAEHDRHDVERQDVPQLLRHVLGAEAVLERQVELVVLVEHLAPAVVAERFIARHRAALAVHVDVDVALQLLGVASPQRVGVVAVADEPGDRARLAGGVVDGGAGRGGVRLALAIRQRHVRVAPVRDADVELVVGGVEVCELAQRRLDHQEGPLLARDAPARQAAEEAQAVYVDDDDVAVVVQVAVERELARVRAARAPVRRVDEVPQVAVAPVDNAHHVGGGGGGCARVAVGSAAERRAGRRVAQHDVKRRVGAEVVLREEQQRYGDADGGQDDHRLRDHPRWYHAACPLPETRPATVNVIASIIVLPLIVLNIPVLNIARVIICLNLALW